MLTHFPIFACSYFMKQILGKVYILIIISSILIQEITGSFNTEIET